MNKGKFNDKYSPIKGEDIDYKVDISEPNMIDIKIKHIKKF